MYKNKPKTIIFLCFVLGLKVSASISHETENSVHYPELLYLLIVEQRNLEYLYGVMHYL